MCLTFPGRVESISKGKFLIDYGSEKREAIASAIDVKVGDYVVVRSKVIVDKVSKDKMHKMKELFDAI